MTQTTEFRRLVRLSGSINRKARLAGVRGTIDAPTLLMLQAAQTACAYCGISLEPGQGTFDHVVPFDRGGSNTLMNLTRCCLTCNREKFTKSPEELIEHRRLVLTCPVCQRSYRPRWGEYKAGRGRVCSRRCSALKRHHGIEG